MCRFFHGFVFFRKGTGIFLRFVVAFFDCLGISVPAVLAGENRPVGGYGDTLSGDQSLVAGIIIFHSQRDPVVGMV